MINRAYAVLTGLVCLLFASGAFADQPFPWQMGMQPAASPIMHEIRWFEQYTLWFIVPITLFVLLLLIVVVVKFRASANPVPSRTSHNTAIEVVWTVGPVLILLFLAIPSFNLLTAQLTLPQNPDRFAQALRQRGELGGAEEQQHQGDDDDEVPPAEEVPEHPTTPSRPDQAIRSSPS